MTTLTKQKMVYREGQPDEKVEWLMLADGEVIGRFDSEQVIDDAIASGSAPFPGYGGLNRS